MTEKPKQTALTQYGSSEDSSPADVYSRYAMGDMLSKIGKDHKLKPRQVRAIIREQPKDYDKTKKSREAFHRLRVQRQLNLADALNLHVLEMAASNPEMMKNKDFAEHVVKLTKVLATRHALNEGKVTSIVGITAMLSDEDMRRRIQEQDEAGDGLAVDDIGELPGEVE